MTSQSVTVILGSVALTLGCGSDPGQPSGGGTQAGSSGASSGSGNNQGGADSAGTGGTTADTGGSSGSDVGGSDPVDCNGPFGSPELVLAVEPPMDLGGPTITADELELFYSLDNGSGMASFVVAKRETELDAFSAGSPVLGLSGCPTPLGTMDVSHDGLRLYYACWSDGAAEVTVTLADRTDRLGEFTVQSAIGTAGGSPAVDRAELILYSSGLNGRAPLRALRGQLSEDFAAAEGIEGLENSTLSTPAPSPDGLALYGAQAGALVVATRPDPASAFGAAKAIPGLPTNAGAPVLTADCRTLYFVARTETGGRGIYAATR